MIYRQRTIAWKDAVVLYLSGIPVWKCKKIENNAEKILKERCYLVYNYLYKIWFSVSFKNKDRYRIPFPDRGNRDKRNPSERDGLIKEVKHENAVFSRLYLKK